MFNQSQVQVRADAGGEGGVIFDSSIALLQGLFPPTPNNKDTLANGKTVVAPLGGYQYIPSEYKGRQEMLLISDLVFSQSSPSNRTKMFRLKGLLLARSVFLSRLARNTN